MSQHIIREPIRPKMNDVIGYFINSSWGLANGYRQYNNNILNILADTVIVDYFLASAATSPFELGYGEDFTCNSGTGVFTTSTDHLINTGEYVYFECTTFPSPLTSGMNTGRSYKVTKLSDTTFRLTDVTITTNGSGGQKVYRGFKWVTVALPYGFWVRVI